MINDLVCKVCGNAGLNCLCTPEPGTSKFVSIPGAPDSKSPKPCPTCMGTGRMHRRDNTPVGELLYIIADIRERLTDMRKIVVKAEETAPAPRAAEVGQGANQSSFLKPHEAMDWKLKGGTEENNLIA